MLCYYFWLSSSKIHIASLIRKFGSYPVFYSTHLYHPIFGLFAIPPAYHFATIMAAGPHFSAYRQKFLIAQIQQI